MGIVAEDSMAFTRSSSSLILSLTETAPGERGNDVVEHALRDPEGVTEGVTRGGKGDADLDGVMGSGLLSFDTLSSNRVLLVTTEGGSGNSREGSFLSEGEKSGIGTFSALIVHPLEFPFRIRSEGEMCMDGTEGGRTPPTDIEDFICPISTFRVWEVACEYTLVWVRKTFISGGPLGTEGFSVVRSAHRVSRSQADMRREKLKGSTIMFVGRSRFPGLLVHGVSLLTLVIQVRKAACVRPASLRIESHHWRWD